ncbi:hypothetical protein CALCODRAFT_497626 [Calocera cornea HHB12733]|uniref:Uncharacterized protein n=1 Tax=Calocera cornea HHB12733 TaxID=1353952 RepID=A0A165F6X6_9BASI|nr:hypothetical protein CALCODRAFT_497626 [Calocera cornea HHB12733]
MLKGWTLTDQVCPTRGCVVPLLRSRDRSVTFCANCDGSPEAAVAKESGSTALHTEALLAPPPPPSSTGPQPLSPTSSPHTRLSPNSTPPTTPPSRSPSLPALPDPSPLTLQRRAQSDLASQRIGDRLLKGWAMLGEECPNDSCWGVPLVRRPGRAKGGRGDGGECVICGWGSESDASNASGVPHASTSQLAARPAETDDIVSSFYPSSSQTLAPPPDLRLPPTSAPFEAVSATSAPRPNDSTRTPLSSIHHSVTALNQTLASLSDRLVALSANPITAEPSTIKTLVEAMSVVMDALGKARSMS